MSERGKIVPRRITAVTAGEQRQLAQAVKRARELPCCPTSPAELEAAMQIILLERVPKLGQMGEVVNVKPAMRATS